MSDPELTNADRLRADLAALTRPVPVMAKPFLTVTYPNMVDAHDRVWTPVTDDVWQWMKPGTVEVYRLDWRALNEFCGPLEREP